jgi:hypothetical protein
VAEARAGVEFVIGLVAAVLLLVALGSTLALAEAAITRVRVDVRVISATNRDLRAPRTRARGTSRLSP